MILTIDVGNTNIKCALFDEFKMVNYYRMSMDKTKTSHEYGIMLYMLMMREGRTPKDVDGIICSSVVPSINFTIEHMITEFFDMKPMWVAPGIKTGINLKYENPQSLGTDRIANAVAAYEYYGGPCIFIDFGTATTYGAMSQRGEFLGGVICPGLKLSMEALADGAAQLPRIELIKPDTIIARNTVKNLQSGLIYGFVGQVDYIVKKMKAEIGADYTKVIATGGMARMISSEAHCIDFIDGELTLKGLRLLYERNKK